MSNLAPVSNEQLNEEMVEVSKRSKGLLNSRYGLWFLGMLSFAESALFVPLITDPFMVAYILLHRKFAFTAVLVTTVTSLIGGFVAFITAEFFVDLILDHLSPASMTQFNLIIEKYSDSTFILGFLGAITPIPYTLAAVAAGMIKGNLVLFLIGTLLGRGIRYGIVGYLTYKYGTEALAMARRNVLPITIISTLAVVIYLWLTM